MKLLYLAFAFAAISASCGRSDVSFSSKIMGERLDHSICWTTWADSELPVLGNFPNATSWNDSINAFESHVKTTNLKRQYFAPSGTTFCCGKECEGDSLIQFPFNEGLIGHFAYQILTNSEEVLSFILICNVHPSGGNLDWNEFLIMNIDPQTGMSIPKPSELIESDLVNLDASIRNCINLELCEQNYAHYSHSDSVPNYLSHAIANNHVGIRDGQWVMCLDFNPHHLCPSMAQNLCAVGLGVEWVKQRASAEPSTGIES